MDALTKSAKALAILLLLAFGGSAILMRTAPQNKDRQQAAKSRMLDKRSTRVIALSDRDDASTVSTPTNPVNQSNEAVPVETVEEVVTTQTPVVDDSQEPTPPLKPISSVVVSENVPKKPLENVEPQRRIIDTTLVVLLTIEGVVERQRHEFKIALEQDGSRLALHRGAGVPAQLVSKLKSGGGAQTLRIDLASGTTTELPATFACEWSRPGSTTLACRRDKVRLAPRSLTDEKLDERVSITVEFSPSL